MRASAGVRWWRPWMTLAAVGLAYLVLGFVLWVHAWTAGATTHTLCGCGDPALFLWFFQWPATALAHGHNPFYSTALFHPTGVNLLSQTSVMGESLPLVPVTWIWGPVASLNVAATVTPALTAFFAFLVLRRWAPWTPAAFLGGLLYGFSPFVLTSLQFAHMMTAALMLIPLVVAVLDDILIRQRHRPGRAGVALGVLLLGQFFLSTELLVVVVLVAVVAVAVVVAAGWLSDPAEVRRRAPHAVRGLAVGVGTGLVLLAWPVWFALEGPAHLSGLVWPGLGSVGGFDFGSYVSPQFPHGGNDIYLALGGYEGAPLGSAGYLGWGLLIVLAGGLVAFWRDRRLWFFGFVLALCAWCSLRTTPGHWVLVPAELFGRLPVIENVIPQRFMTVGFMAAAVMLAVIVDRVHARLPGWWGAPGALVVAAVALVPIATTFGPDLPFAMRPVLLPAWYTEVAPSLPSGRVLLSYPAPFSGIQSAMSWQAVNRINYSQAGGGGPQGVAHRQGSAAAGFTLLADLGFGVGVPEPTGSRAQLAAVRHALSVWQVDTVVVATDTVAPALQQGHDPTYAAAFFTAALGRLPTIEAGAWVWDHVQLNLQRPWPVGAATLASCVAAAEGKSGRVRVTLAVSECVRSAGKTPEKT
jgi:hypothetical protein